MLRLGLIALSALVLTGGLSAQDKTKDVLRIRQNLENPNYDDPKMDIPKVEMISFSSNKIQPLLTYDQSQKFDVFSAKDNSFSIKYPKSWKHSSHTDPSVKVVFNSCSKDCADDKFNEYAYVVQSKLEKKDLTSFSVSLVNRLKKKHPGLEILEEKASFLSGDSAMRMVLLSPKENVSQKALVYCLVTEDLGYAIIFRAEESKFDKYLPLFERMASSFSFPRDY